MATFEAMAWNDPKWADDRGNVERAFAREYPTKTLDKSSVHYLIYQGGASNKFHVFFLAQDSRDNWFAYNAYARIGYNPRLFEIGGPFSSKSQAESLISSKMGKKQQKGYRQAAESFGSESSDKCSECDGDLEDGYYSTYQCQDCYQDGCELCMEDFCGDCYRCDGCCECKCSVCGDKETIYMTQTSMGNVCRGCYDWCQECGDRKHPYEMADEGMDKSFCKECAEHMNRCSACADYISYRQTTITCDDCGETYCEYCEDNNMIRTEYDVPICNSCAGSKCTVCGDTAVHFYKNGEVVMCDKHFQQRYGKYSAEGYGDIYAYTTVPYSWETDSDYDEYIDEYDINARVEEEVDQEVRSGNREGSSSYGLSVSWEDPEDEDAYIEKDIDVDYRWGAEELSVKEPFQTGFKVTLGVIAAGVVGTLGLGALGLILTGLGKGDE